LVKVEVKDKVEGSGTGFRLSANMFSRAIAHRVPRRPGAAQPLRESGRLAISPPGTPHAVRGVMRTLSVPWRVSKHERHAFRGWPSWLQLTCVISPLALAAALVLALAS
jgi:hypothetical protein